MIAIIGAMDSEVIHLINKLSTVKKITKASRDFYVGKLGFNSVVVVKSGIGKVNSAITTTILIEEFAPNLIINTGIVGGVKQVESGDVLLINKVIYHDVDVTVFGYQYGQIPGVLPHFELDVALREKALKTLENEGFKLKVGMLATGDSFLTNGTVFKQHEVLNEVTVVDMEGASIAHTASQYSTPLIMIKKVSDILDMPNQVDNYVEFEKEAALEVSILVERLLISL